MTEITAEITGSAGASVKGHLRLAAGGAKAGHVAVVLDGAPGGLIAYGPSKAGRIPVTIPLPGHLISSSLQLFEPRGGTPLLISPYDLSSHFALAVTRFELVGTVVHGAFTLGCELDPVLLVQLLRDDAVVAECFATRVRGGQVKYEFAWPLASLCALDQSYALGLRIGGHTLAHGPKLAVDARAIGQVGYVDIAEGDVIAGWAVDLGQPRRRLGIDLLRDGKRVASRLADDARADLTAHGLGDGNSAFTFKVAEQRIGDPPVAYALVLGGTTTHLSNSPVTLRPAARILGFFDDVASGYVGGWICNIDDPATPIEVEVVCEDEVIGRGLANVSRLDVVRAGIPSANCGFRINLGSTVLRANLGREVSVRVAGSHRILDGSPKMLAENPNIGRFLDRMKRLNEHSYERLKRRLNYRAAGRAISIIMPVYNTQQDWLIEALESVRAQWCDNWELICVNDHSTVPHVARTLEVYARHDPRFRVLTTPENVGIAKATNFGLRAARYDHVTFMDHDDYLEPDAIYCLIRAIIDTNADFIYSDEVLTYEDLSSIMEVRARPAFSHDYYLSHPYFVHMLCVRSDLARRVAGWDETLAISADVDFVLRILEVAETVAHVPTVLYRWRTHATSTGHAKQSQVMEATKSAIARHLQRSNIAATVSDGVFFNQFRVDYPADDGEILIVIPTKNKADLLKTCISSIERTAKGIAYRIVVIDHESNEPATKRYLQKIAARHTVMPYKGAFNYARMNNVAVRKHGRDAKYVLFCNNDIEAVEAGWLDRLRSLANRAEVGAVGPLLLYGDKRVQHAGVIIGFNNAAEHVGKFADAFIEGGERRNLGYNCSFSSLRDFSAVTAACMLLRREVFELVGGFDEEFAIGFNDTDLCLRIRRAGFKVLYDGNTLLFHHESATRSETKQVLHPVDDGLLRRRWAAYFGRDGDPFYNPNLNIRANDHTLRDDVACRGNARPRVTRLIAEPVPEALSIAPPPPAQVGRPKRRSLAGSR